MGTTRIADVIDPEILSPMIIQKYEDKLFMIPGLITDSRFTPGEKGTLWEIPFAEVLGDLETFVAGTPLSIQNMTQDRTRMVVIRKAGLYGVDKIVELAGLQDPMDYFSTQFADLLIKTLMESQISVLVGGIPSANIEDQNGVSITEAIIGNAKMRLGDHANDLKFIQMHSQIYNVIKDDVVWQPRNNILPLSASLQNSQVMPNSTDMVPTIHGMIIVITDKNPYTSPDYDTYLLGDGAMGLYYQQQVNMDTDRDISLKEDYISPDFDYVPTLFGMDYTDPSYLTADIEDDTNWTIKWDQKQIKAVKIIAKI